LGILQSAPSIKAYCKACIKIEKEANICAMPTVLETDSHYFEDYEHAVAYIVTESEDEQESPRKRGEKGD
jgi:hypothetical protein